MGVDIVTWRAYGEDLEYNFWDLHDRVQRGGYRGQRTGDEPPKPSMSGATRSSLSWGIC